MKSLCFSVFSMSLLFVTLVAHGNESPKRISRKILDFGTVEKVYMVLGMATVIELPTAVTGIRIGDPDSVQYFRPEKPENEVTLVLRDQSAKATNLILRSGSRKFIFDLIPNRAIHQDLIEVAGGVGRAGEEGGRREIEEESGRNLGAEKGSGSGKREHGKVSVSGPVSGPVSGMGSRK